MAQLSVSSFIHLLHFEPSQVKISYHLYHMNVQQSPLSNTKLT